MNDRAERLLPWLVIAAYLLVALTTVLDYGISWDERVQSTYGEMSVDYYRSGFQIRAHESFANLRYYGPFFEMLPTLVYRSVPYWKYEIRHIFIVLAAALGLIPVALLGTRLTGTRLGGALAVLSLLMMPAFYGHTFMNSKDVPFAAMFAWSIYALMRLVEKPDRRRLAVAAIAGGIALAIRVGGVLVFGIVLVSVLLEILITRKGERSRSIVWLVAAGALAWVVMTIFWPWAHANPILHPLQALGSSTAFPEIYEVRFAGDFWPSNELPSYYLAQMIGITTPLPILTLILIGVAVAVAEVRRREQPFGWILLLTWTFMPPLLQVVLRAPLYDGTRHFLFIYPALALLGAIGGDRLIEIAGRSRLAIAGVVVAIIAAIPAMVTLHPYQYVYYNALVGGTAGAAADYELDYWSTSYREAALWIEDHRCTPPPTSLLLGGNTFNEITATYYLPRDVKVTTVFQYGIPGALPPKYDYYVAVRRQRMESNFPQTPVVHEVRRGGATLAVIRGACKRRGG